MKSEKVILEDCLDALHKIVFRETSECEGGGEEKCMALFLHFITAFGESMASNVSLWLQMQPTVWAGRKRERDAKWSLWLSRWPSCLSDLLNAK